MRFDLMPVVPFLDDDGVIRPARLVDERNGRVTVLVTRDVGMTYFLGRPAERLRQPSPSSDGRQSGHALGE